MVLLFLADGFEEIEAITIIDILRRAEIDLKIVSITGFRHITGSHGISVVAETVFRKCGLESCEMIVLPGGMPGAKNLELHDGLRKALYDQLHRGKGVAAICAAPIVLGLHHMLEGKTVTCYPGYEENLYGANYTGNLVERDGNIITGNGPAAAMEFAFKIIDYLVGSEKVAAVRKGLLLEVAK